MADVDPNRSATVLRALKVLEIIGASRQPVSVSEVAQGLGAERTTAYRMLITLADAGYVERDSAGRQYRLGFKVLSLARHLLNAGEAADEIRACLREISEQTRETVHYSVLDRTEAVLVYREKGSQLVTVDFQVGERSPLHCTSIGKVMLAYEDARLVDGVIARGLPKVALNTITDGNALRSELRKVRAQGYAYDDLEFADDMRCVAVPVFGSGGRLLGGVSLSGPSARYTPAKLDELRDCALDAVRRLSARMGHGA